MKLINLKMDFPEKRNYFMIFLWN